jgi:uncharacterized membrane protein
MLALAGSVRAFVLFPMSLIPALRLINMPLGVYVREMVPSVFAAIGMALAVYTLKIYAFADLPVLLRIIVLVPLGAAIYAGLIFILRRSLFFDVFHIAKHILHK